MHNITKYNKTQSCVFIFHELLYNENHKNDTNYFINELDISVQTLRKYISELNATISNLIDDYIGIEYSRKEKKYILIKKK